MFKFLLLIIIFFLVIRWVGKFLFKNVLINVLRNQFENQRNDSAQKQKGTKQGNVYVNYNKDKKNGDNEDVNGGEYIDYEEIK